MNIESTKEQTLDRVPQNFKQQILGALNRIERWINEQISATPYTPPYKSYTAALKTAGGQNPNPAFASVDIFYNTIGNIVWTWSADGIWIGTLAGAFPATKTYCQLGQTGSSTFLYDVYRISDDQIEIDLYDSNGVPINYGYLGALDLRVYN